ncbi:type II toxin-antitoxin system VapC family toxin [Kytococcus sedentarius]|uniref:type II toxin-antitoxin system VapC family toxin n=1 Tax=Kytococcus sedentarius TaxID=1276 RepID=UPI00387A53EA
MIVDSSALVAVLAGEEGADRLLQAMLRAPRLAMSAATFTECAIVVNRRATRATRRRFDEVLEVLGIEVVPFTAEQARVAREAHRDFRKGSGSPSRLNLGDYFTYALAAEMREPLLVTGDDFTHTDLRRAEA